MSLNAEEHLLEIADVCANKWGMLRKRPLAFLLSAFAGGAFVSFGAMLALSVSAGVPQALAPGLANLLMGLVFMFSLVIIMISGMTLVTADMAYQAVEKVDISGFHTKDLLTAATGMRLLGCSSCTAKTSNIQPDFV